MDFAPQAHVKFPLQRQTPSVAQPNQLHPAMQQHLMASYWPQGIPIQGQFMQGGNGQLPLNQQGNQVGTGGPFLAPPIQGQPMLRPMPPQGMQGQPQVPTGLRPGPRM